MFKRIVLAAFLAAVVMMLWGSFFWMMSGIPDRFMSAVPSAPDVASHLKEKVSVTGVYFYPWFEGDDEAAIQATIEQHQQGPIFQLVYRAQGLDPMSPRVYLMGFAQYFALALLAAVILTVASPQLTTFSSRYQIIVLIALFVAIIDLTESIWFHHPLGYRLMLAGSNLASWLLAGLVLVAMIPGTSGGTSAHEPAAT